MAVAAAMATQKVMIFSGLSLVLSRKSTESLYGAVVEICSAGLQNRAVETIVYTLQIREF